MQKTRFRQVMLNCIILIGVMAVAERAHAGERETPAAGDLRPSLKDPAVLSRFARGGKLFAQHCARCHGPLAQGAPNWQQPDREGRYPPPPLNGTAHAWHHPTRVLKQVIREGTARTGGNMPAMGEVVTEADMDDIILWFQSHWPDEIYQAWREMEQRVQSRN